jgi:hypothetical protein
VLLLVFFDTVEKLLRKVNNINNELVNFHPVCLQYCQLYDSEDATIMNCQYCKTAIYKNPKLFALSQKMDIISVGAHLSEMLLSDEVREMMNYHHTATKNHEAGVYKNIFDGAIYRNIYLNERIVETLGQSDK